MLVSSRVDRTFAWRAGSLLVFVGLMWVVFTIDLALGVVGGGFHGVVPRSVNGLGGILTAPFLHGSFAHLLSNTIPLLALGAIILLRGANQFLFVTQFCILAAGLGSWLFGWPGTNHIGASGVVFGYFGFLVARAVFERSITSLLLAAVVLFAYGGGIGLGLLPRFGISWTAHFFGFVGGVLAAKFLHEREGQGRPRNWMLNTRS